MNFHDLQELLRLELLRRIESGPLTGTGIARQSGFRQAHISNFLNRKRALSLDGLDRVLATQNLTVEQILPLDLTANAPNPSHPSPQPVDLVPVVSPATAMEDSVVHPSSVLETVHVSSARLHRARPRVSPKLLRHTQRFVAIRADAQQAAAMEPVVPIGAHVVLDRHDHIPHPHHKTLYAIRSGAALALRYLEFDDTRLILRPLSLDVPVQILALRPHETPADYIVGRVCLIVSEL